MIKLLGNEANIRGKEAEKRFLEAWSNTTFWPEWLNLVRAATQQEDRRQKTDAVMFTHASEPIAIQIKSHRVSKKTQRIFIRQYKVLIISILPDDTQILIREKTLRMIIKYQKHKETLKA